MHLALALLGLMLLLFVAVGLWIWLGHEVLELGPEGLHGAKFIAHLVTVSTRCLANREGRSPK